MTAFRPDRRYLRAAAIAGSMTLVGLWAAASLGSSWLPGAVFGVAAPVLLFLGLQPGVRTSDEELAAGSRRLRWHEILGVESTRWTSPLVLRLTLRSGRVERLIYAGSGEDCDRLLRRIRRMAVNALIDGVPHRHYWGLAAPIQAGTAERGARGRLLREQDEAEVERLFRKLRSKGRLERGR